MNDLDDYDFGSVENSNLSSIFGRDNLSEATNNSLVYKAPKQPSAVKETRASAPNFSYKYINLYEIVGGVQQNLGKYIICLLKPETNTPEILIYQNKKNISIRNSIDTIYISFNGEKENCLDILSKGRNYLLEYSKEDYAYFILEFTNIGGIIRNKSITDSNDLKPKNLETPEKKNLPLLHPTTVLSSLTNSESSSISIGVEENDISETHENKEKEVILARLAKMGLPQLPTLQKVFTDNNSSKVRTGILEEKNKPSTSSSTNGSIGKIEDIYKVENNSELAIINPDCALVPHKIEDINSHTQMLNRPIDPISLMLAENRLNNAELRHQISLLTSSMTKMNPEPLQNKTDDQLKSKLRAYQMKSENLECELDRIKKKYAELQRLNGELSEEVNEFKATKGINLDNSTEKDTEIDIYKSILKQLLGFIQNLPLKSTEVDLSTLINMKENIEDAEITESLESSISFIQNKVESEKSETDNSISKIRTDYLKETKHVMNDLYSKTSTLLDDEMKKALAADIRSSTLELMRNYDEKIHNTIGKYS